MSLSITEFPLFRTIRCETRSYLIVQYWYIPHFSSWEKNVWLTDCKGCKSWFFFLAKIMLKKKRVKQFISSPHDSNGPPNYNLRHKSIKKLFIKLVNKLFSRSPPIFFWAPVTNQRTANVQRFFRITFLSFTSPYPKKKTVKRQIAAFWDSCIWELYNPHCTS